MLGSGGQAPAQRIQTQVPTGVEADVEAMVQSAAEPRWGSEFSIGLGVACLPRYEGADERRLRALPLVNYRNGRFFAGALNGIGYHFSPVRDLEFGPVVCRGGRGVTKTIRAGCAAWATWMAAPMRASSRAGICDLSSCTAASSTASAAM